MDSRPIYRMYAGVYARIILCAVVLFYIGSMSPGLSRKVDPGSCSAHVFVFLNKRLKFGVKLLQGLE